MKNSIYIYILLLILLIHTDKIYGQVIVKDTLALNEIQPIGFGQQPKWMVTSSISQVKGEELQYAFTSNLANSLYGRIPGLTVMQGSGEPGVDSPGLFSRGVGTFGPGRDILVIVDGFESSFEQLVPAEIASISLLKDASATAIFGNRGANGVLMITTKRGHEGPLVVNFRTQHGFHSAQRLPKFLGSYDYASLLNEGLANEGSSPRYSEEELENYRTGSDPFLYPNVNWQEEILRNTAYMANYNLNFKGGNESVRYFVLLNSISSEGLYIKAGDMEEESTNSTYSRFNFRSNVDIDISDRLMATLILGGSVENKANPAGRTTGGMFNTLSSLPPNSFPVYNPDGSFGGSSAFSNPLGDLLQTGSHLSNGRTLQSTLKLTQQLDQIARGLSISGAVSFNNYFRSYSIKSKQYERYALSRNDEGEDTYNRFGQNTSLVGSEGDSEQWRNVIFQGFMNYDRTFGKHGLNGMLMAHSETFTNISSETTNANLSFPFNHVGGGGRFTYSNDAKYIAEFSFGYMGSENFAKDSRFGFFPAGSLGWIVSQESFLKNNPTVSFLKLRSSYGLVGNNRISEGGPNRFLFDQRFPYTASYYLGNTNNVVSGIAEGPLANPGVTWEKESRFNVGFEMTLFDRFDLIVDVFDHNRFDILATPNRTIPQYSGVVRPLLNEGEMRNRGGEMTLRYTSKPSAKFSYFVEANTWYAQNEIVFMSEQLRPFDYQNRTGMPLDQPFGLRAVGLFASQAEIDSSPAHLFAPVKPGDVRYEDMNQDGVVDQNDVAPVGKPGLPTTTFSFQSGLKFKGFDMNFMLQGVTGNSVYLGGLNFHAFQNNGQAPAMALDRWTPETAGSATYPRLSASNNLNNYRFSSFWQRDGTFMKMRNLEFGYSLSESMSERLRITSARLFVNGTNLFSLDRMDGYRDPETGFGYPAMRTLSLGASFQF